MPATKVKRKATADMNDSPPKRVTRAHGKATDAEGLKPTTKKIVTASAKAAAEKKKAGPPAKSGVRNTKAKDQEDVVIEPESAEQPEEEPKKTTAREKRKPAIPARPTKRKTRADDEVQMTEEPVADEQPTTEEQQTSSEPAKVKGRSKKISAAVNRSVEQVEAPKPRGRQPQVVVVELAPKTRGRPRKTAEPEPVTVEHEGPIPEPAPAKKTTRGRAATVTSKPTSTIPRKVAPKSTAAAPKRVKFQEEPDKENIPIESTIPKKSAMKPTGMKAKPVRKPAATRGSTRGKKATQEVVQEANKRESMPLSPKKDKQIAKSDPASSEDELCGAKTPIRALSQSPAKRPMSPIKDFGGVSKLNFNYDTAPSSPVKIVGASILASPARRPPASPFKDALKSPPKRVNLGDSMAQPVLLSSRTPMKVALLQESPKRGKLGDSAFTTILGASKSPFKASLLQSPARRPMASPKKHVFLASPENSAKETVNFEATSPVRRNSPAKSVSSPAESPQQANIESIVDKKLSIESTENDSQTRQASSPEQQGIVTETPTLPETLQDETVAPEDIMNIDENELREDETADLTISPEPPAMFAAPAFKFASAWRRVSMESDSGDELASPQKEYEISPMRRHGISTKDFGTPAVVDCQAAQPASNASLSFTPLVDQLNSWTASSPNKQIATTRPRQGRGIFSLGGVETPAASQLVDQMLADGTPAKSSFFDDEMAMIDDPEDSILVAPVSGKEQDLAAFQVSQESQTSDEYGDENSTPNELEILRAEQDAQDPTLTCTPAKVFTPARAIPQQHREFHTVSKVPLRASAEGSPLKVPRQRSRSFGGPLASIKSSKPSRIAENQIAIGEQPATPVLAAIAVPQTPSSAMNLDAETPGRSVRKGVVPDVLKGAVVYVDVHTTEGADASGIFVDLLTQMGARCVKQWNWNPRASMSVSLDSNASPQGTSPDTTKVGITHVVYKDGGKRTLEKVRTSNGVVSCVGVGWVLE